MIRIGVDVVVCATAVAATAAFTFIGYCYSEYIFWINDLAQALVDAMKHEHEHEQEHEEVN